MFNPSAPLNCKEQWLRLSLQYFYHKIKVNIET